MDVDEEIDRLEASIARMDEYDPEEIEPDDYAATLKRLVELRQQRDTKQED